MHRIKIGRSALLGILVTLGAGSALAEEWPGWRGPRSDGTSLATNLPLKWSGTDNVVWKVPIPGRGYSSPAIWGDRIFLTTALEQDKKQVLYCLDRTSGKILWERSHDFKPQKLIHKLNSHASSTPATDGKYVYITWHDQPKFICCCYDFAGTLVWQKVPGEFHSKHGFCSSPILYKDTVILNGDQDAVAWLVALDKQTGTERWRADRPNRTRSYTPPLIVEAAGKMQLVLSGSKCVASYNPDTGKQIWIIDGPTEQYVASLVYKNDIFFMTYGFPKLGVMGIKPDGTGNITETHVLYNDIRGGGYVPSPIAHGDYFFNVNDNGIATCRQGKTGELQWLERLGKHHSASPITAGPYLYFPDDDGITWVLKAGPKFDVVAKNELGEETYASFAVAHNQLFIRGLKHLYCIGTK